MDMHATGPGLPARRRTLQALLAGAGAIALPALAQPMDRPLDVPFVPTSDETVDRAMAATLPWDGVPTLYNSHWGLEHARPLAPYEHLIGHTNDFARDAAAPRGAVLDAF